MRGMRSGHAAAAATEPGRDTRSARRTDGSPRVVALALHDVIGNRGVLRLFRAHVQAAPAQVRGGELSISSPGDREEIEADAIADELSEEDEAWTGHEVDHVD